MNANAIGGTAEALVAQPPGKPAGTLRGALLSAQWYRVAALKPRLRPQARMARHRYRGQTWFVLSDSTSGRSHRLNAAARFILNGMDGTRSVDALWSLADAQLGEQAPTQDELIHLMAQLHAADLLQCDINPDVAELFQRGQQQQRQKARQAYGNPMSIKLPLFDPDRLLNRLMPWVRPLWNRWGVALWLAVVLPAALLAASHWQELTHNLADRVFALGSLLSLWLMFPLLKALHELGHGLATKARGGAVHDMGLMLLVLMPVPYVDASASSAFPDKRDRALVAAAGMLVELFVAAWALYLWLLLEPGLARSLAFNVMLVAGVSTLLFNGNPLLRYDAYYILADLIEIPNLATRANRHVGALAKRWLFKVRDEQPVAATTAERAWLSFYAVLSFFYRTWISIVIVLFIAGQFFIIGVLLALWAVVMMLGMPLFKLAKHLFTDPSLAAARGRVHSFVWGGLALLLGFVAAVPLPQRSHTQGVVWLPEQALLRAGADGFLAPYAVPPGTRVKRGELLVTGDDPTLRAQLLASQARVAELQAQLAAHWTTRPVDAALARQEIEREEAQLARWLERSAAQQVVAPADGVFVVARAEDQPGRFHRKGELLGYVVDEVTAAPKTAVVRVLVPQSDIDLVRSHTQRVELRLAPRFGDVLTGRVVREVPAGQDELPSRALAPQGGGSVAVDPRDAQGLKTLQRSFQVDIELDLPLVNPPHPTPPGSGRSAIGPGLETVPGHLANQRGEQGQQGERGPQLTARQPNPQETLSSFFGARVYVRFVHDSAPLAVQWARSLRQMFLGRFHG